MITIYGIANCDTVKRARTWLKDQGIEHRFHDFRKDGIGVNTLQQWLKEVGADVLINRRGTTWRRLSDADKTEADGDGAAALLAREPSLIKRPVFDLGGTRLVGFSATEQKTLERASTR